MKSLTLTFLVAVLLFGNINKSLGSEVGWNAIKGNSVLWGQVLGCLLRFKSYPDFISEESPFDANSAQKALDSFMPRIDETIERLGSVGVKAGFLTEEWTLSSFTEMVSGMAKMEAENGVSWLQAMGCYKTISDLEIMSE